MSPGRLASSPPSLVGSILSSGTRLGHVSFFSLFLPLEFPVPTRATSVKEGISPGREEMRGLGSLDFGL